MTKDGMTKGPNGTVDWFGFLDVFSAYGVCVILLGAWASAGNQLHDSWVPSQAAACAGVFLALAFMLWRDPGREAVKAGKMKAWQYLAGMAALSALCAGVGAWLQPLIFG